MIVVDNIYKSFSNQRVLNGITLKIDNGERVILMGQNGAGKTTLVRCILGEYKTDLGKISICGSDPIYQRTEALKHIAFVPQMPPPLRFTVSELIDYSSGISRFDKADINKICEKLELDVEPQRQKSFHKLSGGMKQKLLIAIAFSRQSDIMIFDEPTANLDPTGRASFNRLLSETTVKGKTLIFISHRIEEVSNLVNRVIELDMGGVIKDEKV